MNALQRSLIVGGLAITGLGSGLVAPGNPVQQQLTKAPVAAQSLFEGTGRTILDAFEQAKGLVMGPYKQRVAEDEAWFNEQKSKFDADYQAFKEKAEADQRAFDQQSQQHFQQEKTAAQERYRNTPLK